MASGREKSNNQTDRSQVLEEQIDSMPIVEKDVVVRKHQNGSEGHESNSAGATTSKIPLDDNIPQETNSESMPSSGIGSPSAGPGSLDSNEAEEKERLIQQVLELQNTLTDLSLRVDSVKEENLKLRSENQVLGQYIENLMSASNVFQSTSPSKSSSAKKSAAKK